LFPHFVRSVDFGLSAVVCFTPRTGIVTWAGHAGKGAMSGLGFEASALSTLVKWLNFELTAGWLSGRLLENRC
jgi:hypothetical protein